MLAVPAPGLSGASTISDCTARPTGPPASKIRLSAWPKPSLDSRETISKPIHSPTGSRASATVRSGLMKVWVSKSSIRLTPLPKSAAADTRCNAVGASPATTGTRSRVHMVTGPRSSQVPAAKRRSNASVNAVRRVPWLKLGRSSGRGGLGGAGGCVGTSTGVTRMRRARTRATSTWQAETLASTICTFFPGRVIAVDTANGCSGTGRTRSIVRRTTCIGAGAGTDSTARANRAATGPPC